MAFERQAYDDVPEVLAVEEVKPDLPSPPARRPLLEIVLDPRNITYLLSCGGVMVVVGLVLYLYSIGLFENPTVVAGLMGAGTVGLLLGGWALIRMTRYETAGRALTLLACMIMPLNLWFYHAQDLHPFTLHEQLWIAALVCCALYTASAMVVKDRLFVYVLVAGVCATCLLILADVQGPAFWQITSPSILLVGMGLLTLHLERAFPDRAEGDFTRRKFGMAFFWSGHVVLALGLLMVLGAQYYGFVYHNSPWLESHHYPPPAPITTVLQLRVLALLMVLAGTYAYIYSDVVVRRVGLYLYPAVFTLVWAEILLFDVLQFTLTTETVIVVLALTGLAAQVVIRQIGKSADDAKSIWARTAFPMSLLLSGVPVLLGVGLHFRYLLFRPAGETHDLGWTYVGAMSLTVLCCMVGAWIQRQGSQRVSAMYLFGAATATLVGAAGLLAVLGVKTWAGQAPVLMLVPLLYLAFARMLRGDAWEKPVLRAAHLATVAMLFSSLVALVDHPVVPWGIIQEALAQGFLKRGAPLNLALAVVFAEAAVFYALIVAYQKRQGSVYLAAFMAGAAVWQLLSYARMDDIYYVLCFAITGLAALGCSRILSGREHAESMLGDAAARCGNALLLLGYASGMLLTLAHLAIGRSSAQADLLGMLSALVAVALLALFLARSTVWRRIHVCAAVGEAVLAFMVLAVLSDLSSWQKLEIVTIVLGLGLLALGHLGYYRERENRNEMVSFSLFLGSVLVCTPLVIAVTAWRTLGVFHWPDELGLFGLGLVLFLSGTAFRLKSTTLAGLVQLVVYLLTLPVYLPWSQWNLAAILLMAGGGGVFLVGLLLSVFRERLLSLPQRVRQRESVFRVLSWR